MARRSYLSITTTDIFVLSRGTLQETVNLEGPNESRPCTSGSPFRLKYHPELPAAPRTAKSMRVNS